MTRNEYDVVLEVAAPPATGKALVAAAFDRLHSYLDDGVRYGDPAISPLDKAFCAQFAGDLQQLLTDGWDAEALRLDLLAAVDARVAVERAPDGVRSIRACKSQLGKVLYKRVPRFSTFIRRRERYENSPQAAMDKVDAILDGIPWSGYGVARALSALDFLPDDRRALNHAAVECARRWWSGKAWQEYAKELRAGILKARNPMEM